MNMNQKHRLDSEEITNYETALHEVLDLMSSKHEGIQLWYDRYLLIIKTVLPYISSNRVKILDAGCGAEIMSLVFRKVGHDVFAIHNWKSYAPADTDYAEAMFQRGMLEEEGIHAEDLDIAEDLFPFQDDSFDIILFLDVIEHLHGSPKKVLREMHRVLRKKGILILTAPNLASLKNRLYVLAGRSNHGDLEYWYNSVPFRGHIREPTIDEVKQMLVWEGFTVVTSKLSNCLQLPIILKIRSNPVKALIMMLYLVLPTFIPKLRYMILVVGQKQEVTGVLV